MIVVRNLPLFAVGGVVALAVVSPVAAAAAVAVAVVAELAARLAARRGATDPGTLVRGVLDHGGELHRTDPAVGFVLVPNADLNGRVALPGGPDRVYRVRTDADGCRRAAANDEPDGRPVVAVFGCSWTFGSALNDDDTYPWLLQAAMPWVRVKNYAVGGDSLYQMLLRLERSVESDRPVAVVVAYLPAHDLRNVGAMHRIPWFAGPSCRPRPDPLPGNRLFRYPVRRAVRLAGWRHSYLVRAAGTLVNQLRAGGAGEAVQRRTTEAVFLAIRDVCERTGAKLLVASLQLGNRHTEFLTRAGIPWVGVLPDVTLPGTDGYRWLLLPYDNHPNEAANRMFAAIIGEALDALLRGEIVRPASEYLERNARAIDPRPAELENTYPLY